MGDTYTRQSSYTDGDVITAAHTNDEFNQLLAAFQASTGHTHDGTANEGGPITKLLGNTLTFGAGTAGTDITITFDGETSDGVLKWMEDEDYFEFSDDILIASTEKLQFRDTAIYINSSADGQLDLVADTEIQIAATTVDINGNVDISGTLTIGSAGISEAELEILDGATVTTAELNILDGVTATTAELNILDGVTSTAAELNILDGVTSTTAELNILDGVTATTAELNILDGVTSSTAELNILDGVTATAAELNILDGVTSTTAELNILDGVTSTASEINLLDGSAKSTSSITIADSDAFIIIDGNTTKQIPASDLTTYLAAGDITGVTAGVGLSGGGSSGDVTLTLDLSELSDVTPANGDKLATLDSDGATEQLTTVASLATLFAGTGLSASSSVISIDAAQTGITSLLATDIKIGEDDQTKIDFETADEIHFYAANAEQVFVADGVFGPQTDSDVDLGTTGVRFKDAFVDSLTVTGDISVGDDLTVEGGVIDLKNTGSQSELRLYCEASNAHYAALKAPAHSDFSGNTTLTLPATTDTIVGRATTDTLTNKTLTSPKINENVAVTATATELNLLDGVTATTAELNILDGVTSTATELNILDGVTSTTAELNILDGVTSTAAELNLVDGITAGTVSASKAVIADSNKDVSGFRNVSMTGTLTVTGDAIAMNTNTAGHLLIADGTDFNPTAVGDLSEISTVANDDVFLAIDTSGGGLKKITRSTIVSGLAVSGTGIDNIVEDTTPQLGGNLDVNGNDITGSAITLDSAGDIILDADGTDITLKDGGTTFGNFKNSSGELVIQSGSTPTTAMTFSGANVTLAGNLTVSGTTTTVNSTTVTLDDHNIVLDSNNSGSAVVNGAGITLEGGSGDDATFTYNTTGPKFELKLGSNHEDLQVDQLIAASLDISGNVDVDGTLETDALSIASTTVTATAAELNIMDGVTATTAELNIMDGVTATTAELNILDGATVVVGEINALDLGSTAVGTAIASKAVILDSNKDYTGIRNFTITGELDAATLDISGNADIDGTLEADAITVGGTALNTVIAGVTVTDATNAAHVLVTDNESTNEDNLITFVENATSSTGNVGLEMDGNLTYNPSTGRLTATQLAGTLQTAAQTNITSLGTLTTLTVDNVIVNGTTIGHTDDTDLITLADGVVTVAGEISVTTLDIGGTNVTSTAAELNILDGVTSTAAELNKLDGVTATTAELNYVDVTTLGTVQASKAVTADANGDVTFPDNEKLKIGTGGDLQLSHNPNNSIIQESGSGSLFIDASDLNLRNSAGDATYATFADGGAVELNHNNSKKFETTSSGATVTGELVATSLDISGDTDIDGTLEADAITVNGTALDEFISDTTGAMFSSNTETGVTVTYQDSDNTIDVAINASQTTITSLLATDIKIGEDDQTKIDFETADEIHFYAANAEQVFVSDGVFGPETDSDVDLGTNSARFKDAYVDSVTVTGDVSIGDDASVSGRATGTQTTDNDGNFDLSVSNFFKCTPSGNFTLTLSNPAEGQSGTIMLVNTGGHTVSAHASIAINADILTALSTAGTYMLSYYCSASSGNDTILVGATGALT